MHTLDDVKKELIDHLHGIDKTKLGIADLKVYVEIVKIVDEISRANEPDKWMEVFEKIGTFGASTPFNPVAMKEV